VKTPVFAAGAASAQEVVGRLLAPAQPTAVAPRGTKASSDERTRRVPVLMYHRILPAGEMLEDPFSTTLEHFERQLDYLQQMNCYTVASSTLSQALRAGESLPGRPVLITFDDGYVDFATLAWPALRRRNFNAEVFLVTALVGRTSEWDSRITQPAPLMDWPQIRALHDEGVVFGSHFATHTPVTHLSSDDLLREAATSRAAIERELDAPATSVALPFGLYDDRVAPILEWSGYSCGFSTKPGLAGPDCDLLRLPRLNAGGEMGIERFRKLLPWPDPAGADRSFQ
jgi:peptidoglycan/xylan/chitin deacetylase (PgdA/CDA1 family)